MRSAYEIPAEQVMDTDPVTAQTGESVSQVKHKMEENNLRAIAVLDEKGRLEGAISYRELVRHVQFNPETTDLDKVMHQPPEFELEDNLVELSDLRINSGRKMLVNVDSDGRLEGVVEDRQFLEGFRDLEELDNVSTGRLATRDMITVFEDDTLEEARHKMLDNNISRVPVLDDDDRITGMIDSVNLLRMLVKREKQSSGGTSGNRHGREEVNIAGGNERIKMSKVTADQLMTRGFTTSEDHMPATEAVEKMLDEEEDDIIFIKQGRPEAIITLKDLIKHVADRPQKTILVQLTGVDLPEEKAVIHNKLRNALQGGLGRKLDRPQDLSLRVKKSEKDGKKHRWELDLKLVSGYGVTTVNEEGWEFLDVLDEAINELDRVIRDKHEKRTEHR